MNINEIINILTSENAAGITHFIKEFGNGSMKEGLAVLFEKAAESEELKKALSNALIKSKKQNTIIWILATAVLGLSAYIAVDKHKKNANLPNNEESLIKAASEELEGMSEEEVEEAISNALELEETRNVDREEGE